MDPLEEAKVLHYRYAKLLKKLVNEKKFTLKELGTLLLIHYQAKQNSNLDRRRFRTFIHGALDMTDNNMTDRIFISFDSSSTNWISIKEFVQGLYIFFRGSPREKVDFCFSVYDQYGEGKITRGKMFQLLRRCIVRAPSEDEAEEEARDLVEALFMLCDQDKDGSMSLVDFREAVQKEPLLMEALGPCLPDWPARDAFLTAFAEKPPSY